MNMLVTDYLEYYFTVLGWVLNNGFWLLLAETGVFLIPIIGIVTNSWLDAKQKGTDEGSKAVASINNAEVKVWTALVVIMLTCVPAVNLSTSTISYTDERNKQCDIEIYGQERYPRKAPEDTAIGSQFEMIGNESARVPLWWWLVHGVSKGYAAAGVAKIPCTADVRQIAQTVDATRIKDPVTLAEISDFASSCYGAARAKLLASGANLTVAESDDTWWLGSSYFLSTPGYYDTIQARNPIARFPFHQDRDEGYADTGHGGYPTCKEWWSASDGLKSRILNEVDPSVWVGLKGWFNNSTEQEIQEETIRQIISPKQLNKNLDATATYRHYSGANMRHDLHGVAVADSTIRANLGVAWESFFFGGKIDAIKSALPMLQSAFIMVIVVTLPFAIFASGYNITIVATFTFALFALHMLDFWFALATWADASLLQAIDGSSSLSSRVNRWFSAGSDQLADQVMNFLIAPALFIILPGMFFVVMSWAGVKAGGSANTAITAALTSSAAGSAGNNAAKVAKQVGGRKPSK